MIEYSIIIPAFNEAGKIVRDMEAADEFLASKGFVGEIIVVDDGSRDGTGQQAKKAGRDLRCECVVESLPSNRGKGCAVRHGILKSRGRIVVFADSGLCVPYHEIELGVSLIESGQCQIAHGSRKLDSHHILQRPSLYRRICSGLFHWFLIHDIKRLGNLTDTQCGFKVYEGDVARQLYGQSTLDGFMFDVEIVLLALSAGHTIGEFPVSWTCDLDSRLKPARETFRVLSDLIRVKHRFRAFLKS